MKVRSRIISTMAVSAAVLGGGLYAAPVANAAPGLVNNGDGSVSVSGLTNGAEINICASSVSAFTCSTATPPILVYIIDTNGTYAEGGFLLDANGGAGDVLLAGTYTFVVSGGGVSLSNVTIGTGGGSSSASSAAAPTETLTLAVSASGATCTVPNPSGVSGSWLTLPSADQCTQSGPTAKAGAVLLGWSTSASFPIARAQAQVDKKWGAIDETIDGIRMIFIPAGMPTFVSGSNNLFPIWSK